MTEIVFFKKSDPISLGQIAQMSGVELQNANPETLIYGIAPLDSATPKDLAFIDNPAYAHQLETTRAAAIICGQKFLAKIPAGKAALIARDPYRIFAQIGLHLYPDASKPTSAFGVEGLDDGAHIHPKAKLEANVTVDAGAVIGAGAQIGAGTTIAANAVIGANCCVGRNCSIGPGATITNTLLGNRVIIHAGARIGQDGFGFAMGPQGHLKVPQIGRVIIQDDVEIGAGTCVDRGANKDTMIGEGTKIDNMVQIGHNVRIGRHCVIVSQVGISGSSTLEDYVVLGGQVGVVGHVRIGMGAQIAGSSNVREDVPAGAKWGGTPAKPIKDWFREMTTLKKLSERQKNTHKNDEGAL